MKASNQYTWGIYLTGAGVAGLVVTIAAHIAYAEMNDFTSQHGHPWVLKGERGFVLSAERILSMR